MTGGVLGLVTVFILAVFVGFEVISRVPTLLHTPLMSGTNAVHGVILVGSIVILAGAHSTTQQVLGFFAVLLATLNVVGGFTVTDRMLEMFKGRKKAAPAGRTGSGSSDSGSPNPGSAGSGGAGPAS